ncbi:MAG TPA: phage holin family protein [Flavobacteriaceae bacterium]|nr:phage holin family protein [Flavobacteriaceae bacterium]HIN99046.1 phage holin family protein [Flavobacteriaceae bacterium]
MQFKALSEQLGDSGDKIQEYLKSTAEYYKLRLFKNAMKFATSLINMLILGGIFMMFLIFISFGVAMWLGKIFDSMLTGFFIVGVFYLVIFLLILFFGKNHIDKSILSKFSELVVEDEEEKASEAETEFLYNDENVSPEDISLNKVANHE